MTRKNGRKLAPVHPGEILQKEFLEPLGLSQNRLALALHVPARRINEIVLGKRAVTPRYGPASGAVLQDVRRSSGWACRWTTNSISPKTLPSSASSRKSNPWPPPVSRVGRASPLAYGSRARDARPTELLCPHVRESTPLSTLSGAQWSRTGLAEDYTRVQFRQKISPCGLRP